MGIKCIRDRNLEPSPFIFLSCLHLAFIKNAQNQPRKDEAVLTFDTPLN